MNQDYKIGLGKISEMLFYSLFCSLYPKNEGYSVKHVNWKKYNYGHGVDLKVFEGCKQILGIECKNWRDLDRPYGTDIAETEIIDRFKHHGSGLKLLIISFIDLLTKQALQLLKQHGIHIIEVGKLIGKKDFKTRLFYELASKIRQTIKQATKHGADFFSGFSVSGVVSSKLTNYYNTTATTVTTSNNLTKQLHDTNTKKQLDKLLSIDQINRIEEAFNNVKLDLFT